MLKRILQHVIANNETNFIRADGSVHDRSQTLGGSEVGQCIRKSFFDKNGYTLDEGYTQNRGYFARGHNVEDWATSTTAANLSDGELYQYIGDDQITLVDGRVSVTPDGLFTSTDGTETAVELKSTDPRTNLDKPKAQHVLQNQLQIELFHKLTDHRPTSGVIVYVDASDYNHIVEHPVERDPSVLDAAHTRANLVFDTKDPMDLMPEGAWDDECRYCGYTQACGNAVVHAFPTDTKQANLFDDQLIESFNQLIARREKLKTEQHNLNTEQKSIEEKIKQQLRKENATKIKSVDWSISFNLIKGRRTLDAKAAEAAGIDLSPYYTTGKSTERLTIKTQGE